MPILPNPPLLTADNTYEIAGLLPGEEYLLTFKGTFGGATVELQCVNDVLGTYTPVDGGAWDGYGATEVRYVAPSSKSRLVVTNADTDGTTSVAVTHVPLR
ncbi:hypothetical protein [Luteolibacter sp. LG18]|uniref:hypothetical protein n=1 Tax=Luteolibacter sp. LG18 TaxID=2819286 RepID=UPI002B2C3CCA|nr:hypothetical protein llg_25970 [Luteolibacter sp. LG18]